MNIAITGGIGAGKSTMINLLMSAFPTASFYSMDKFVDELYQDPEWQAWLRERFNTTDRKEISNRAFACDSIRATLNSQSALKIGVKLGKALANQNTVNFVEFPLLFESSMQGEFDLNVLITASTEERIKRVVARGKKTPEEAASVINAQMPEEKKITMADMVVDTTGKDDVIACCAPLIYAVERFLKVGIERFLKDE